MITLNMPMNAPYGDWITGVTTNPARIMDLPLGKIIPGSSADLIIFPGRYFSELLARSQHNRIIIRKGKQIKTQLPDYRELDDLIARN
jgi:cytosine/creatinine deaminase